MSGKNVEFSLRVMINKQKTKVLYAEANGDFVDVLLSFLTMPVGKAVKVLEKHYGSEAPVIGSLNTFYKGLGNLDSVHFWTQGAKELMLNPRSSFESECCGLKLDIADTQPPVQLACEKCEIYITSIYCDSAKCMWCGDSMVKQIQAAASDGGVFAKNGSLFIISDDLQIVPDFTDVSQIFSILGITETDLTKLENVTLGFSEIMDLFKASLFSPTPLSDIILARKTRLNLANVKSEPGSSSPFQKEMDATFSWTNVILKVFVHKSTNKILYARAGEDFINFLIGFLTIPLGRIGSFLGRRTCFKSIDILYRSIAELIGYQYLKTSDMQTRLKELKLPHGSVSRNQILRLTENQLPTFFGSSKDSYDPEYSSINFPQGEGNYVKGPRMYTVADDLTITPFCISSHISTLEGLQLTMTDIKEVELQIGQQEGLRILKASLTSTCVLTDALTINLVTEKQPKRAR